MRYGFRLLRGRYGISREGHKKEYRGGLEGINVTHVFECFLSLMKQPRYEISGDKTRRERKREMMVICLTCSTASFEQ